MAEVEKVFLPDNANFMCFVNTAQPPLGYWEVLWPSSTLQDVYYTLSIEMQTKRVYCNCVGFAGGIDKEGKFFPGRGICSHVRKFRWVVSLKKRHPKELSIQALLAHTEDELDEKMRAIISQLRQYPRTCDELEVILNMKHQTCSALINKLHYKMGFIEPSGDERPTRSGPKYMAIVWRMA